MKLVISGLHIKDNALLLVLKKGIWILPGGKFDNKVDKKEEDCLIRECVEEMGIKVKPLNRFGKYNGITPHSQTDVSVIVWFMDTDEVPGYYAEISETHYFPADKLFSIPVSEITNRIIKDLCKHELLKPSL